MQRKTQGASIIKGWEDKQDLGHIPDTFTSNNNNTSMGPPQTPNNWTQTPSPHLIIIIWGVSGRMQHSRCYITVEAKAMLKIRHKA